MSYLPGQIEKAFGVGEISAVDDGSASPSGKGEIDPDALLTEIGPGNVDTLLTRVIGHYVCIGMSLEFVRCKCGPYVDRGRTPRTLADIDDKYQRACESLDNLPQPWDEPDWSLVDADEVPPPTFPLDVFGPNDAFWANWLRQLAEAKNCPIDYVAAGLLVTAASLIGNSRQVSPWPGWDEPIILWCAIVGPPSSSKTPALDTYVDALSVFEQQLNEDFDERRQAHEAEKEAAKQVRKAWEGTVREATESGDKAPPMPDDAEAPQPPARWQLYIQDVTAEIVVRRQETNPRGLLVIIDELAGWVANFDRYNAGSDNRALWIQGFGARPYKVDRVKDEGRSVLVPRLSLSVIGGITPDKLQSAILNGPDDGFCARFLYVAPKPVSLTRPNNIEIDPAGIAALSKLLGLKLDVDRFGAPQPVMVRLTEQAADVFHLWRQRHDERKIGAAGSFQGHLGKYFGLVLRIALVLVYLDWCHRAKAAEPKTVSEDSVNRAVRLVDEYFVPMAERVFGGAALSQAERDARSIAHKIVSGHLTAVNARNIRAERWLGRQANSNAVKAALGELVDAGWLLPHGTRAGGTAGRPSSDYRVNPWLTLRWDSAANGEDDQRLDHAASLHT